MKTRTLFLFAAMLFASFPLAAQTTVFTYQGRLMDGSGPANGNYEFQMSISDQATNGATIAGPIVVPATASNGLFTLPLDFGSAAFPGDDRWLQLSVRTNGASAFITLFPSQPLTPMPYTIHSANSAMASGVVAGSINNLSLADGSITSAKLAPGAVSQLGTPGGSVSNAVQVTVDGSIGIGTSAPRSTLEVAGTVTAQGSVTIDANNANSGSLVPGLLFGSSGLEGIASERAGGGNLDGLDFYTEGIAQMSLASYGYLGIGTNAPQYPLHVNNSGHLVSGFESSSTVGTWLSIGNDSAGGELWNFISTGAANGEGTGKLLIHEGRSTNTIMTLQSNGFVGIGTSFPQAPLHIVGTNAYPTLKVAAGTNAPFGAFLSLDATALTGGNDFLIFSTGGGAGEGQGKLVFQNHSAPVEIMCMTAGGNVGIGNLNPTNKLMVVNARCDGNTWINSSDRNLKENFASINSETILDRVVALPISRWTYKNDTATPHLGPVAQDFHASFGLGGDDRSISTVDENGVALAAIQGLDQRMEERDRALVKLVAQKDSEIRSLQERLETLEKTVGSLQGTRTAAQP